MKKVFVFSIYMLAGISGFANTSNNDIVAENKSEVVLTLNNVKEGQELAIKDAYGSILYNTTIKTTGLYNNKFDLTALPDGQYSFEHEKGFEIEIMPFTVSLGNVTFNKSEEKSIFKPVIKFKENKIYVSKLDLNKEDVDVKIYYTSNNSDFNIIHSETFSNTTDINRIYSLAEKRSGSYKVIINANGRNYVEQFKI
ncbi:hypothetical protein [Formosa algae]|uniref:Secretion system C-terminal sorting domain-containing protein n=1 Tax=Formosa algae TaxID=225843 RepID=A0A9X1CCP5_9FLAO|nr:hypothetical protein [Formosa algae]MBP1840485.1 hypothetical protein [Formosa algae]MDQ0336977.1 hypothetical protein [Formosa algae]OEI80859.1 hypothetical protein AST99_07370 [Formosa algae]